MDALQNFPVFADGGNRDDRITDRIAALSNKKRRTKPVNYRVEAAKGTADIYIYDEIGFWGITAQQFARDLKELGNITRINLHVSSDGGEVFDGRAIFTQLAQHPARITAYVDGLAASIASLIIMSANEIRVAEGSFIMIHNAWTVAVGNAADMRKKADLLDTVDASIRDTYERRTKNEADQIKAWMDEETWFTAQEAVDNGFADVLDEPLDVAARLQSPGIFHNIPKELAPGRQSIASMIDDMRSMTEANAAKFNLAR